jgi:hypothetical protein
MRKLLILGVLVGAAALALTAGALSAGGSSSTAVHVHPQSRASSPPQELAPLLARARFATARYATSLHRARAHGYRTIVTQHIPDMGWHFMNPNITEFNVERPPILVYVKRGHRWQLVAFEWVFTERPVPDPLPGAQYGTFAAACHYVDGTFVPEDNEADCPRRSPISGARFSFWHPDLVTLHLWAWYPNPDGVYAGFNPLIRPFN